MWYTGTENSTCRFPKPVTSGVPVASEVSSGHANAYGFLMPELLQNNSSSTATEANGASQSVDYAADHLARLYSPAIEEPWFRSLFRNIREAVRPPQLPPLQVTSKPVAVRDIWGLYG